MSAVTWKVGTPVKLNNGKFVGTVLSVDEDGYHKVSDSPYHYLHFALELYDGSEVVATSQALKADAGKLQWGIVMNGCAKALLGVVNVMNVAITPKPAGRGYAKDSWKLVPEAKQRYTDALYRHMAAIERGEVFDDGPEGTGQLHADCVATNALFLSEFAHGEHDVTIASKTTK